MKPSITEKEFKEACKDCYTPDFYIVLGEASNTPEYLRRYFELLALKQKKAELLKEIDSYDFTGYIAINKKVSRDFKKKVEEILS